jgi:PE-PPE domain
MPGRGAIATTCAIAAAGLVTIPPLVSPLHTVAVHLISVDDGDSPLGDGTALIFGTSGTPVASPGYQEAVEQLYLQPRGFDGTVQAPFTPEGLYPVTGVHTLPVDTSFAQEEQILDSAIQSQIAAGGVDAANPVVVFGWSQSADFSGLTMPELAAQGVPSDDVHFVLVGDASNPDGGLLERFDLPAGSDPSVPSLGITFDGATPADLYPTDIYTNEYDGFADFPKYPIDFLSDLNAFLGIAFDHITYLDPDPGQLADAIQLPTSTADTLTNYYMVPEDLPLLDPLRFIPVIGNPLADLLQPDMSVLVNLGYGSIEDGWSPGYADVPSPFGLFPTDLNWGDVLTALVNGIPQGVTAAVKDLEDPANYQVISSILDNPLTNQLISIAHTMGFTDATNLQSLLNIPTLLSLAQNALSEFANFPISDATLLSSPTDLINDFSATLSADYATLVPVADTVTALLTSLPSYDINLFTDQLEAGNLLGAVGDPIAADIALVPFAIGYGAAAPILEAVGGTLLNLVDLIPGL